MFNLLGYNCHEKFGYRRGQKKKYQQIFFYSLLHMMAQATEKELIKVLKLLEASNT